MGRKMQGYRLDSMKVDQTYYTEEGYLVDHPVVTRCGVFEYADPEAEDGIRRELRIPEEVFAEESLASYEGKPIIITHDAGQIDKDNVHREQIGTILGKGYRDGENVRCKIVIHNTDALKRCRLRELSLGYEQTPEDKPGVYEGQAYDVVQRDIRVNHLALVGKARAGDSARLNIDHKDTAKKNYLKGGPVMVKTDNRYDGDLTPEEIAQAIALFRAQQGAAAAGNEDEEEVKLDAGEIISGVKERKDRRDSGTEQMDADAVIAEQKGDIEALLNVIDQLQAASDMSAADGDDTPESVTNDDEGEREEDTDEEGSNADEGEEKAMNADSVDRIVSRKLRDYLDVCRVADRLNLDGVEDLDLASARKKVIKKVNPKLNLDGKSEAYINAAYDIAKQGITGRKKTDDQRRSMMGAAAKAQNTDSADASSAAAARERMIAKMKGER